MFGTSWGPSSPPAVCELWGWVCEGSPSVKAAGAPAPRLLDRLREALRLRHYSRRTEKAYVGWVRRFVLFHDKRHPQETGRAEDSAFLSLLATRGRVSASTQNQALSALQRATRGAVRDARISKPASCHHDRDRDGRVCIAGLTGEGWRGQVDEARS